MDQKAEVAIEASLGEPTISLRAKVLTFFFKGRAVRLLLRRTTGETGICVHILVDDKD